MNDAFQELAHALQDHGIEAEAVLDAAGGGAAKHGVRRAPLTGSVSQIWISSVGDGGS